MVSRSFTNAYFSSGVNLYLIDHIEDTENTHHYVLDDPENHPVRMESAGKPDKTFEVVKLRKEELGSLGYEAKLGNEVKPVWKWDGGLSPGDMPFGEIIVGKTYPTQVNVLNKMAAGYGKLRFVKMESGYLLGRTSTVMR